MPLISPTLILTTGKSSLAKVVATVADSTFFSVSASILISKWQGDSERLVRVLFEMARESPRTVIFIDEVDSLFGTRREGECDMVRRVKTEFLNQMEGVGKEAGRILVLGATNVPWELDPGFRRRFEKRIYIPLPDHEARSAMVKIHLGDTPNNLSKRDLDRIGQKTEGASGADIKVLVREASMKSAELCRKARQFLPIRGFLVPCEEDPNCLDCPLVLLGDPPKNYDCEKCGAKRMRLQEVPHEQLKIPDVSIGDFIDELKHFHATVTKEDLESYTKWTKQFGQDGA
jgi:vacuolar protein-sorting-associated protein 4